MTLLKTFALALPLLLSFSASAQEYVTIRRKAPLNGLRNTRDEMRVVSKQILAPLRSGNHQAVGLAQVQLELPVCGSGNNAVLDVKTSNLAQQLAAMGGPLHLFESQDIDLGFYLTVRRGVAIADVCRITPTLVTLTCGYRQPVNLARIPSRYISEVVEGITCRYNFEKRGGAETPFIDISLTRNGIEVFNGL